MSEEYGIDAEATGTAERSTTDGDDRIGFSQLFDLLSKKRRRYALYGLTDVSGSSMSLNALVDRVESLEDDDSATRRQREEIKLALQHTHLPKLADADVIEYDRSESELEFQGGRRVEQWIIEAVEAELESGRER